MTPSRQTREVMWRRVTDNLSFEQARIVIDASGAEISGTVLAAHNRFPFAWTTASNAAQRGRHAGYTSPNACTASLQQSVSNTTGMDGG